jgi:hypothetical protein
MGSRQGVSSSLLAGPRIEATACFVDSDLLIQNCEMLKSCLSWRTIRSQHRRLFRHVTDIYRKILDAANFLEALASALAYESASVLNYIATLPHPPGCATASSSTQIRPCFG